MTNNRREVMYQLTVKETLSSKTWTHELGSHIPEVPRSFTVIRMNLLVSTMFLPPAPLKNFLINILNTSSAWAFDFKIEEVPQETPHQTVAIFKGMDVVPEENRLLVLHMVTGDEKLEELEKRAEADDVDPRFTPQKIVDALADVLSEIFPEAKVHVRKS